MTHELTTEPRMGKPTPARRGRVKDLLSVNVGNTLEWFDWNIYAIFAPFFAQQFFVSENPVSNVLSTLAIFAVGFLMRPVGGWVFGRLADRKGRRFSLTVAIVLAAVGSLMIAVSPTHAQIGVLAAVVLLLARMVQGLSHGGETGSAFTYLAERAPEGKRGMWASTPWIGVGIGTLMASGLGVLLTSLLTDEQMNEFGWRIPFAIGALVGVYAIFIRLGLTESKMFEEVAPEATEKPKPGQLWRTLWAERRKAGIIAAIGISGVVAFYTWFIFAPSYAVTAYGMDPNQSLIAGAFGQVVFIIAILPLGALCDRIGRKPVVIAGCVAFIVLLFPLEWMLGENPWSLFATMAIASLLLAAVCAPVGATWCELVPTKVRATVVGVTYATSGAIFGGTAPYLNTWLSSIDQRGWFVGYMMLLFAITTVVVLRMPETRNAEMK